MLLKKPCGWEGVAVSAAIGFKRLYRLLIVLPKTTQLVSIARKDIEHGILKIHRTPQSCLNIKLSMWFQFEAFETWSFTKTTFTCVEFWTAIAKQGRSSLQLHYDSFRMLVDFEQMGKCETDHLLNWLSWRVEYPWTLNKLWDIEVVHQ